MLNAKKFYQVVVTVSNYPGQPIVRRHVVGFVLPTTESHGASVLARESVEKMTGDFNTVLGTETICMEAAK